MKKRILALCLTLVLVLGLLPPAAYGESARARCSAAFFNGVKVDGVLNETAWRTYGQLSDGTAFGALWDSGNLYLAAETESLTVQIGGNTVTPAETAFADGLELRISFAQLGLHLRDYSQTLELRLVSGDAVWEGTLGFSSLERSAVTPNWNLKGKSVELWTGTTTATSVGSEAVADGMRLYNKYVEPVDDHDNKAGGRVYWIDTVTKPWENRDGAVTLELDLLVSDLPEYAVKPHSYTYVFPAYGMNFALADGNGEGITTAVTNTAEGLYFAVYSTAGSLRSAPLGKTLGQRFHLTQTLMEDGSLRVWADDVLVAEFANALREQKEMKSVAGAGLVSFNLWCDEQQALTADGALDSDVTVTHVTYGVTKGETALDALSFDDFRGGNQSADAVTKDLNLITSWSNGQLKNIPISWSSSDPAVIDPVTGAVAPVREPVQVTLTASVTGTEPAVTKSFVLTVAPMELESYFTDGVISLDGAATEQSWPAARTFNHVQEGGPTGSVSSVWYQETAYFAVHYADAAQLKLELQGCAWTVELSDGTVTGDGLTAAAGNGTVELAVDLAAAGIKLLDYNTAYSFQITLTGAGGTSCVELVPLQLIFVSKEQVQEDFSGSGENYKNYVVRDENNGLTFKGQHTSDPEVLYAQGISAVSFRKNVLFEMDLDVKSMPCSTGAVASHWQADGLFLFLVDYDATVYPADPSSAANYMAAGAVLFNTESGLMLRVRKGQSAYQDVPLGKTAGEGAFKLGLLWRNEPYSGGGWKGCLDVYADGYLLSSVDWVNYNYKGAKDSVNFRYYEDEAAEITLSNVTVTVNSFERLADELTKEATLGDVDLTAVGESLTLPETFDSPFLGTLPLRWESSDETVLTDAGVVTRPAGKAGRYVYLTLHVGDRAVWTQEIYVLPADTAVNTSPAVLGAAFTAEPVICDGALTDAGWSMNTALQTASGEKTGRLGAQWDTQNLYLAVETAGLTPVILVNGKQADLSGAAVSGTAAELEIPLAELGITELDYGKTVPVSVELGGGSWSGTVVLTSNDWFYTDSVEPKLGGPLMGSVRLGNDEPTPNQGVTRTEDGFRFFDRYDPAGANPAMVRSYAIFFGNSEEAKALLQPLADRTVATYVEFDFCAEAMPLYTLNNLKDHNEYYASSGFCWLISDEQINNLSNNIALSILRTENGLVLAVRGKETVTVNLDRQLGDLFRLGIRWERSGAVTVFVDGEKLAEISDVETVRGGVGNTALAMSLIRSHSPAADRNDNFEIAVTNIALGKTYGDSLLDSLSFDSFRGENTDAYAITEHLALPQTVSNPQLTQETAIRWSSSEPSVIAPDGTVTPAAQGTLVVLTAQLREQTKAFELYVPGTSTDLQVLIAENDKDTANGAGQAKDIYRFTLDANNNSVVFDQKQSREVTGIILTDSDETSRLNESNLTVWVSEDNASYTRVDSFKLLRSGKQVYLYDFSARGRYVKVHCTVHTDYEADFTAELASMIRVSGEAVFGANGGSFTERTAEVTNRAGHAVYDRIFTVDGEAQRVLLDGELLYHYTENGVTYVRVPVLQAGETAVLRLLSGNDKALDLSNREYVHEVVYGTREVIEREEPRWIAAMPDGRMVGITTMKAADDSTALAFNFSYDKGLTWTALRPIECSVGYALYAGGVGVDPDTGRIICHTIGPKVVWNANDSALSDCKTWLFYSDDCGETWSRSPEMTMEGKTATYYLSYTDPTKLQTADGASGEGVDFVLPLGVQSDRNDGSLVCRVARSTDGGATWTLSASEISYTGGDQWHYEGGVSESTILQQQNGTLVLYGRCQYGDVDFFARSYSYDHGVTWVEAAELSEIYTVNTQPLLHRFNGQHIMTWAGNTVLGGNSYKRYPLNVAASTDDGMTFSYIQDLFSRTPLQNMTSNNAYSVTNQHVASVGDTVSLIWGNVLMRVDHFTDYLYRTKGVYDSFENSTVKAEGWAATMGTVAVSENEAYTGSRAMKLEGSAAVTRSIPYLQNGTVSMALYPVGNANMTLELEAAHGEIFGKASPVALEIVNGVIGDTGLTLRGDSWNTVSFETDLTEGVVFLTVNGETARLDVNEQVGDYICWIDLTTEKTVLYVDAVTVTDDDVIEVPEVPAEPELPAKPMSLAGASMTLSNDLTMNFYVSRSAVQDGWYARISRPWETVVIPMSDWKINGSLYQISYSGIAAKEMVDVLQVTLYDAAGKPVTGTWSDSVRGYATRMLERSDTGAALKTTLVDMLNYGAAAQVQFGYRTDDLANSKLTEAQRAYATRTVEMQDLRRTAEGYVGSSLELETNIRLKFVFESSFAGKTAVVRYTDHYGKSHEDSYILEQNGSYATVSVNTLVVADCCVPVSCTVGEITVVDSVESYCARMQSLALREPLMKFAVSARALFQK